MASETINMHDIEKDPKSLEQPPTLNLRQHDIRQQHETLRRHISNPPFAGRLGGNQAFVVDRDDSANASLLGKVPDAAPGMTLAEQFDLRPFRTYALWRAAIIEGMGTFMFVYISMWINISPGSLPVPPTAQLGQFASAAFIGPLIGALIGNFMLLTLFIYIFGAVSGAHLNPTITIATFCGRLCSLPRMLLYIPFQVLGATLAGLLIRASYGTRDFKVGGCWMFSDIVPVGDAFAVEFVSTTLFLFFAFGLGLDPRQLQSVGPSLAPFLIGMALAIVTFGTAFSRYGYGGASLNPARCFGTFVGSRFPGWHWHHWVADIVACMVHGVFYFAIPPWQKNM